MTASSHPAHQGDDVGRGQLDGGLRVMSTQELRDKRKKIGLCLTCGETRTHKPGIWKSLMPDTIDGVVYKGICLKCSTLDAAKLKLGEPLTGPSVPDDMERNRKAKYGLPTRNNSATSRNSSQSSELKKSQKAASLAQPQALKHFPDARLKKSKKLDSLEQGRSMPTIESFHEAQAPEKQRRNSALAAVGHFQMMQKSMQGGGGIKKMLDRRGSGGSSLMSSQVMTAKENAIGEVETEGKEDGHTKRIRHKTDRHSLRASMPPIDPASGMIRSLISPGETTSEERPRQRAHSGEKEKAQGKRTRRKSKKGRLSASMPPVDLTKENPENLISSGETTSEDRPRHKVESGGRDRGNRKSIRRKMEKAHLRASMKPMDRNVEERQGRSIEVGGNRDGTKLPWTKNSVTSTRNNDECIYSQLDHLGHSLDMEIDDMEKLGLLEKSPVGSASTSAFTMFENTSTNGSKAKMVSIVKDRSSLNQANRGTSSGEGIRRELEHLEHSLDMELDELEKLGLLEKSPFEGPDSTSTSTSVMYENISTNGSSAKMVLIAKDGSSANQAIKGTSSEEGIQREESDFSWRHMGPIISAVEAESLQNKGLRRSSLVEGKYAAVGMNTRSGGDCSHEQSHKGQETSNKRLSWSELTEILSAVKADSALPQTDNAITVGHDVVNSSPTSSFSKDDTLTVCLSNQKERLGILPQNYYPATGQEAKSDKVDALDSRTQWEFDASGQSTLSSGFLSGVSSCTELDLGLSPGAQRHPVIKVKKKSHKVDVRALKVWDVDASGRSSISSGSDLLLKQAASVDDDCMDIADIISTEKFSDFNSDHSSSHTVHETDTVTTAVDKLVSAAVKMTKDRDESGAEIVDSCGSDDSCSYSYCSSGSSSGSYHSSDYTSGSSYSYFSSDFTSSSSYFSSDSTRSQSDQSGAEMNPDRSKATSGDDCNIGWNDNCNRPNSKSNQLGETVEPLNQSKGNKLSDTTEMASVKDPTSVDANGHSNHIGIEGSEVKLTTIESPNKSYSYQHTNELLAKIEALSDIEDNKVSDGTLTRRFNIFGEEIEAADLKATNNDTDNGDGANSRCGQSGAKMEEINELEDNLLLADVKMTNENEAECDYIEPKIKASNRIENAKVANSANSINVDAADNSNSNSNCNDFGADLKAAGSKSAHFDGRKSDNSICISDHLGANVEVVHGMGDRQVSYGAKGANVGEYEGNSSNIASIRFEDIIKIEAPNTKISNQVSTDIDAYNSFALNSHYNDLQAEVAIENPGSFEENIQLADKLDDTHILGGSKMANETVGHHDSANPICLGAQIETFDKIEDTQISSGAKVMNFQDYDSCYSNGNSDHSNAKVGTVYSIEFSDSCQESDFGTLNEENEKTKNGRFCPTCGVRTHSIGSLLPETVEGLVNKGTCLRCNSIDAAKLKLGEPLIDYPHTLQRSVSANSRRGSLQATQVKFDVHDDFNDDANARSGNYSADGTVSMVLPPIISKEGTTQKVNDQNDFFTKKNASSEADALFERELKMINIESKQNKRSKSAKYSSESSKVDTFGKTAATELQDSPSLRISYTSTAASTRTGDYTSNRTKISKGRKKEIRTMVNCHNRGYQAQAGPSKTKVAAYESVNRTRCSNSNGKWGFYSGTLNEDFQPHGSGEMVYDDGHIEKGNWSNGTITNVEKPKQERYKPCLLPGYAIGDVAHTDAMALNSREANVVAASKLHVGDCAFIHRSDGTYTYAIVKSLSDLDDVSITFQVDSRGATKNYRILQWGGIKVPAEADTLPGYELGDPGLKEVMITDLDGASAMSVSRLRVNDACFTKRSNGSWTYGIVVDRLGLEDDATLKIRVDKIGSFKKASKSQHNVYVRRIKNNHRSTGGLTKEDTKTFFRLIDKANQSSR